MLDEQMLRALFNQFDASGSGQICPQDIITAMCRIGHPVTQEQLDEIFEAHDDNNDGVISFREFTAVFYDLEDIQYECKHDTCAQTCA